MLPSLSEDMLEVLQQVWDYIGECDFVYVAGVARSWRDKARRSKKWETSFAAVLLSVSRLVWAVKHSGLVWSCQLTRAAAASPNGAAVLDFAVENGLFKPTERNVAELCLFAVEAGQLSTLCWVRSRGFALPSELSRWAASRGRLDILRFAQAAGNPWDARTACAAAAGGHLAVLQYARANGSPWCPLTCSSAALN
ncbi:unnamed protein product, partial [Phaeothamnion confervicola]